MSDSAQIAARMAAEQAAMGNKPGRLFGVIPLDWQANAPFAMQSCSPVSKNIPTVFKGNPKGEALARALGEAFGDMQKMAQSCGVLYAGHITNGAPVINNAPVGSGAPSQLEV